ncbi:MAG: AAA domain-containing protein, partial [Planktomarina sp.]|nr:AAA domain-containing protein [Planktomarina sp.]
KRALGNELICEISDLIQLLQTTQKYEYEIRGAPNWEKFKLALTDHSGLELHEYVVALNKSLERYDDIESSLQLLNPVQEWLSDEAVKIITDQIITDEKGGLSLVTNLFSQSNKVELFQRYRHTIGKEESLIGNFFEKLSSVRNSLIILKSDHGSEVRRIINREVRLAWKQEAEESSTGLFLDQQEIRQKVQTLSEYIKEMRELNRLYLQERYERDKHARSTDWESITRLTGARSLRLREFISRGSSFGLFDLKPVWLMNPDVAARMLPLIKGLFDVVVFDEASQLPVEHSLHVLYRGKRVIISGDEKQMPPTAFFQSKIETEEAELEGGLADDDATDEEIEALEMVANSRDIKDCTNLLNLASSTLHTQVLKVHYRSKFRELIAFSNASFYQNSLHIPVRHPSSLTALYKPIEYIEVNGVYKDQQNPAEAAAIVNRLQEFWEKAGDSRPSVGIVTFNRKQADLIQEYIEKRAEIDSKFRVCLSEENTRYEDGEDMSFFVKNVENVQGDERDVILFSSTFGKNEHGRFRRFFGVLGAMGGERRLNVAVTRAREKIMFFTSMPVSDVSDFINVKRPPNTPRDYLQGYLQYAKLVSLGEFDRATALTNQLLDGGSNVDHAHEFNEDGFIQIVSNFIFECGFTSTIAREATAFSLDILIKNPETGQFSLGIECDAPQHNLLASARSREIWRPEILRLGIPYIHRVSSINWYTSQESEKKLLRQAITSAFRKELK